MGQGFCTSKTQNGVDYGKGRNTPLRISPVPFHDVEIGCWVYPNKGTKSTTGIGGVQALSACSFVIASGWFQQRSVTRHWDFHSTLMWLNIFCMVTSRF